MAKKKVGFIGNGNVAKALARGLEQAGHEVRLAGKDPPRFVGRGLVGHRLHGGPFLRDR